MKEGKQAKRARLRAKVADFFELPSEIVLDLPRLVLTGKQRLLIENHRGIKEYAKALIRLSTPVGTLRISGQDLEILAIAQEQVEIEGRIDQIEWEERGEEQ
ncbi:MAG: sporulation protein YqfC [Firmicutes bacterium]|nr:sporulation protein YqfC [Bacillota bacterium]